MKNVRSHLQTMMMEEGTKMETPKEEAVL